MRDSRTSSLPARILCLALGLSPGAAHILRAQETGGPEGYGIPTVTDAVYPAAAFSIESPTATAAYESGFFRYMTSGFPCFAGPVQLPTGVKVLRLLVEGCDNSSTENLGAVLFSCPVLAICELEASVTTSGSPGCAQFQTSPLDFQIDNAGRTYVLRVCTNSLDVDTKFRAVRLLYQLQLSPAPATPTFGDVPTTHLYFRAVEALAASGITGGCGGGNFCPSQNVTRGEMAAFLARALGLHWPN